MIDADNDIIIMPKPINPDSLWITVDENNNLISEGMTPDEAIKLAKGKSDSSFTLLFVPREGSTYIF